MALILVGLTALILLFDPFRGPQQTMTAAAQPDPADLGPLPFDSPPPTTNPSPAPPPQTTAAPTARGTKPATHRPTATLSTLRPTRRPKTSSAATPDATEQPARSPERTHDPTGPMTLPATGLPHPAPPTAKLSPAALDLGSARTGTVTVKISPGTGIWSTAGANRVSVESDGTVHVDAPAVEPGCPGPPRRISETVIISWSGRNTGDSVTTEGTSRANGILTLSVTWTVVQDKGVFVPDGNNGGYWSNCSPNSPHYPGTPAGSRP